LILQTDLICIYHKPLAVIYRRVQLFVVAFSFDDFGGIIDHPPLLRLSFHTARIHVDAWCQNQYFDDHGNDDKIYIDGTKYKIREWVLFTDCLVRGYNLFVVCETLLYR
jgi:hypothetical protein